LILPALSVNKRVTFIMVFAGILGVGLFGLSRLGIDLYPKLVFPQIMIFSQLNGAGPTEMENLVTRYLEMAASSTKNVKTVSSVSSPSLSLVTAEFNWGTNMDQAETDLRRFLDRYKTFLPDDATDPMVLVIDASLAPTMFITFSSEVLDGLELRRVVEDEIEPLLRRVDGVGSVSLMGGMIRQINVQVDPVLIASSGLSIGQITGAIAGVREDSPAGEINIGGLNANVKIAGSFENVDEIRELVVGHRMDGSSILLDQVAVVEDGLRDRMGYVRLNGQDAVIAVLFRRSDANAVNVSDQLERQLELIRRSYGAQLEVNEVYSQATFIKGSISNLWSSALQALFLTMFVLLLFLRSWRSSSVVAISIPMSVIATFAVMYFANVDLNIVSMAGLALSVGMLVDNSIVVLENIVRRREGGESARDSAIKGASEVGMAITASTLTTVAVFVPVLFVPGLAGQIFRDMSLTISFSLIVSLFVALTLIPVFASQSRKLVTMGDEGRIQKVFKTGFERFEAVYFRWVQWAVARRKRVIIWTFAALVASIAIMKFVPVEFFPQTDEGFISANSTRSPGTVLTSTDSTSWVIEEGIHSIVDSADVEEVYMEVGQLEGFSAAFGSSGSNNLNFFVTLVPRNQRSTTQQEYADSIRTFLSGIPDLEYSFQEGGPMTGSSPIEIRFYSEDLALLRDVTSRCAEALRGIEGTRDVQTSMDIQRVEFTVYPDEAALAVMGLARSMIGGEISAGIMGQTAGFLRDRGQEIDINVRYSEAFRSTLEDVMAAPVFGAPLAAYGRMIPGLVPQKILRNNSARMATVTCSNTGRALGSVAADVQSMLDTLDTRGLRSEVAGQVKDQQETFMSLILAIIAAALLVYMVMASQFESFLEPFIIMFTVPMAFIGVAWTLLLTGTALSVTAMIGMLMLAGIVVNNGIVLIDFANRLRGEKGLGIVDAASEAGRIRLRPVLMTAMTTVIGMTPLALGIGESGETWAPMARTVMGGLSVATLLTLFVLPCLYVVLGCRKKIGGAPACG
jgi:hydrophobic/amphiphilic exporter-1 (mainly G- bacteria), HAE1 family